MRFFERLLLFSLKKELDRKLKIMILYIDTYRDQFGVESICKALPIAPSTYHEHKMLERDPQRRSIRAKRDAELAPETERVWKENFEVYGVSKVWRQMRREGVEIARCTVARLMSKLGLKGVTRGQKAHWTDQSKILLPV